MNRGYSLLRRNYFFLGGRKKEREEDKLGNSDVVFFRVIYSFKF